MKITFNNARNMENQDSPARRKVVIVGAGDVGSTHAFALAQSGLAEEIALIDKNSDLVKGQVLDLVHGQPFFPTVKIRIGEAADYTDAGVIVITAGAPQQKGETRLDLLRKNATIIRSIMDDVIHHQSKGIVVIVSNPVDVLTYVALRHSAWPRNRIMGSGTVLDSARLRYLLSEHCGVDAHNVHAYILGEHGDSEFAAWSMTHIAGMAIDRYCPACRKCENWIKEREKIETTVRNSAYHIIDYKGATYYAVALAMVRIVGAILRGQNSVLTVSTLLEGEFGLQDVCLSLPCLVSYNGAHKILECRLPENEMNALEKSSILLKEAISGLETT
jgi:L-lactate dehydrogenase